MKTKEAIEHVLKESGITKYRMAQQIGCSPTSINQWLGGTIKMSLPYALLFEGTFGIEINDTI